MANMANPVIDGTLGGRPFVNQYVDVVHEDLFIKLDEEFEIALFEIKYHIKSSEDGVQIPFLFYASKYLDSFIVKIDGKEVKVEKGSYDFRIPENTKFKDFAYFFEKSTYNDKMSVLIKDSENSGFYIGLNDMIYFETDISKGEHTIDVSYRATKWIDGWDWINEYSFRYALSPAKYWKSFGSLDVTLDAVKCNKNLTFNIGLPNSGKVDSIATWHFEGLPVEILQIIYAAPITKQAEILMNIGPSLLSILTGLVLAIIHFGLVIWYRKNRKENKYSIVVILGSILIPLFFLISWMKYYDLIDHIIGNHAS